MNIFIIRGRFQPFASYHYYAARALILHPNYKAGFEKKTSVILYAIVRNQEIIEEFRKGSVKKPTTNNPDTDSNRTRYLPLFNPLSTVELILQIQGDIARRVKSDQSNDADFLKSVFQNQTIVAPMSVTAKQLCEVLVSEANGYDDSEEEKLRLALATNCIDLLDDNLDLPATHWPQYWVIPVLDQEDIEDALYLHKKVAKLRANNYVVVVLPIIFEPLPYKDGYNNDLIQTGTFGFFGGVAAYLHDKYLQKKDTTRAICLHRENELKQVVDSQTWEFFKSSADSYLANLMKDQNLVSRIDNELEKVESKPTGDHFEFEHDPVTKFQKGQLSQLLIVAMDISTFQKCSNVLGSLQSEKSTIAMAISTADEDTTCTLLTKLLSILDLKDYSGIYHLLTNNEWTQFSTLFQAGRGSTHYHNLCKNSDFTSLATKLTGNNKLFLCGR